MLDQINIRNEFAVLVYEVDTYRKFLKSKLTLTFVVQMSYNDLNCRILHIKYGNGQQRQQQWSLFWFFSILEIKNFVCARQVSTK